MLQKAIQITLICLLTAVCPAFCKSLSLDLQNPDIFKYKKLKPYMIELRKNIEGKWVGCKKERGKIQVFFELDSGGQLLDLRLVKGIEDSDSEYSALNAVEAVFPCAIPPANSKPSLKILATFDCDPKSKSREYIASREPDEVQRQENHSQSMENYDYPPLGDYPYYQHENSNLQNQQFSFSNQSLPNQQYLPNYNYGEKPQSQFQGTQHYDPTQASQRYSNSHSSKSSRSAYSDKNWAPNNEEVLPETYLHNNYQNSGNSSEPTSSVYLDSEKVDSKLAQQENLGEPNLNEETQSSFLPRNFTNTFPSKQNLNSEVINETEAVSNLQSYGSNNFWFFPMAISLLALLLGYIRNKKVKEASILKIATNSELDAKVDSLKAEMDEIAISESDRKPESTALIQPVETERSSGLPNSDVPLSGFQSEDWLDESFIDFLERESVRIVFEYEQAQGRKVRDVSKENLGYDLVSSSEHEERHIEVKGKARQGIILVTPNEWKTAKTHSNSYYLYIVENLLSKTKTLKIIQNPYAQMTPDSNRYTYVFQRSKYLSLSESIQAKTFVKGDT